MMHERPRISKVAGSFPWTASYASRQSPRVKYWQVDTPGSLAAGTLPLRANTEGWQRACDRDASRQNASDNGERRSNAVTRLASKRSVPARAATLARLREHVGPGRAPRDCGQRRAVHAPLGEHSRQPRKHRPQQQLIRRAEHATRNPNDSIAARDDAGWALQRTTVLFRIWQPVAGGPWLRCVWPG